MEGILIKPSKLSVNIEGDFFNHVFELSSHIKHNEYAMINWVDEHFLFDADSIGCRSFIGSSLHEFQHTDWTGDLRLSMRKVKVLV